MSPFPRHRVARPSRLVTVSAIAIAAIAAADARATPIRVVTSVEDGGAGSLRRTIADAAPGDVVVFSPALDGRTIALSSPIELRKDVTVEGPSARALTVSGQGRTRVFTIDAGATVTLRRLTIARGHAGGEGGGGVRNLGALTLEDAVVRDCRSAEGGGVANDGGTLIIARSALVGNRAANGGALRNDGRATLTNVTIAGNEAVTLGGGVSNRGRLTITFSTIAQNRIAGSGTGSEAGGGVATLSAFIPGRVVTTLEGTIVARNSAGPTGRGDDVFGEVVSRGFNFVGTRAFSHGLPGAAGDRVGTDAAPLDPGLGPLAATGGAIPALAPLPGSPVIDRGGPRCPSDDARASTRPRGAACDVGAVERRRDDRDDRGDLDLRAAEGTSATYAQASLARESR